MSNEEIVSLIQSGSVDYYSDLWGQIERLVRWKAQRIISVTCNRGGAEFEDLYQSGYLAMVAAVDTYDPDSGSFVGWFTLYLKKAFAEASGKRSQKQAKDPLHSALSLDYPLTDDSDADELQEIIPDPVSEIPMQRIEKQIYLQQLRNALEFVLNKLPDKQRNTIRKKYLEGISAEQIAIASGVTRQSVEEQEKNGLRRLRQPGIAKILRPFYEFDYYSTTGYQFDYYRRTGAGAFKRSGMSIQERYLIDQEKCQHS